MESSLSQIQQKPTDYKICKNCKSINWYENQECIGCMGREFSTNIESTVTVIEQEYSFYIKDMNISEEEADSIYKEV